MKDISREAFEAHVKNETGDIAVSDEGRYISPKIHGYWLLWQASRAALDDDLAQSVEPLRCGYDMTTGICTTTPCCYADAQSVEPVAVYQGAGNFRFTGLVDVIHAGAELFTHPPQPPATTPASGARAELIKELRRTASKGVSVWGDLQMQAADMLEADAQAVEPYDTCLSNCETCKYSEQNPITDNPAHCYMFRDEPIGVCAKWLPMDNGLPQPQATTPVPEEIRKIMLASELKTLAEKGCGDCYLQDCSWPECSPKAMALKQAAEQGDKP